MRIFVTFSYRADQPPAWSILAQWIAGSGGLSGQ